MLEGSKRIGGAGNNIMTLRTYIKWNGSSWVSMTTPGLVINNYTTALTIISNFNSAIVLDDLMGKIYVSSGNITASSIGTSPNITVNSTTITDVSDIVTSVLTQNKDPFAVIKYNNGKYFIEGTESVTLANSNSCIGCNLENINLSNFDLNGKDLSQAYLRDLDLSGKNLTGTNLTNAKLSNSDLSGLDLTQTNLTYADLSDAYLVDVDLTGKDLSTVNLDYAYMNGANLTNVILPTNILNIDFSGATWIDSTELVPHICGDNSFGQCN